MAETSTSPSLVRLRSTIASAQMLAEQVFQETQGPAQDPNHPDKTQASQSWRAARECRAELTKNAEAAARIIA